MNTSFDAYPERHRSGSVPRKLLAIVLLFVLAILALAFLRRGGEARLSLEASLPAVGQATDVAVTAASGARGLVRLRVEAVQGEQRLDLADVRMEPVPWWAFWRDGVTEQRVEVEVGRASWPALQPGEVTLVARADTASSPLGAGRTATAELTLPVRLVPPGIESLAETDVVRQGGAGVAVYLAGETSLRDGVRVGEHFFPGSPLPDAGDGRIRFAFFAVPHDLEDPSEVRLVAQDALGNRSERAFLQRFDRSSFAQDEIRITDRFLEDVVPEILGQTPGLRSTGVLVEDYVKINRELRAENRKRLLELGRGGREEILWQDDFLQMPGSRVMAGFGEDRTYLYEGRVIDRQTHLGYDLASVRRAEVPAAAGGVVMMAEFFGIYGRTVLLDHGYGLASLYSHLSEIDVEVGEKVARGDALGRTGTTGLAGGDHLHFAVLVRGVQVDPLEWLDGSWIESRIRAKLRAVRTTSGS